MIDSAPVTISESVFTMLLSPSLFNRLSLIEREDLLPVIFHADHGPILLLGLTHERIGERADFRLWPIGVLALVVIVMHQHHQPHAVARLGVFEHLFVAYRVAERRKGGDRSSGVWPAACPLDRRLTVASVL